MKVGAYTFFVIFIVMAGSGCVPGGPKAKLTVRVVDDDGKPVADAVVAVLGFNRERKGKTDREGRFTGTFRNATSGVDIVVDKTGYYSIGRHIYEFTGDDVDDRWQPWNPTIELQLRKKGKPVPMLEKDIQALQVPVNDQPVGYDLELADWVFPQGHGKISDFILRAHSEMTNDQEYASTLLLTFSNPQDGLINRPIHWRNDYGLVLPAIAPENGYSNRCEFVLNVHLNPVSRYRETVSNSSQDDNYYIRVRTKATADGRIQSAMYGKIHGGLLHRPEYPSGKISVYFYYYLNTNGTRNTESLSDRRRYGDMP